MTKVTKVKKTLKTKSPTKLKKVKLSAKGNEVENPEEEILDLEDVLANLKTMIEGQKEGVTSLTVILNEKRSYYNSLFM